MSMNLLFETRVAGRTIYEDFPFQTSSELTREVLKASCKTEQITIIRTYVEGHFSDDIEFAQSIMEEVVDTLVNDETVLGQI